MIGVPVTGLMMFEIVSVDKELHNEMYLYVFGQLILSILPIKNNTQIKTLTRRGAVYYSICEIYPNDREYNKSLQNVKSARQLIAKCMKKIGIELTIESKRIMTHEWS